MPNTAEESGQYAELLDKLAEDYPELGPEVDALNSKLEEIMPMDSMDDEMPEEAPMMPGDMDAIPPELMDEEEMEDEDEYEL